MRNKRLITASFAGFLVIIFIMTHLYDPCELRQRSGNKGDFDFITFTGSSLFNLEREPVTVRPQRPKYFRRISENKEEQHRNH